MLDLKQKRKKKKMHFEYVNDQFSSEEVSFLDHFWKVRRLKQILDPCSEKAVKCGVGTEGKSS